MLLLVERAERGAVRGREGDLGLGSLPVSPCLEARWPPALTGLAVNSALGFKCPFSMRFAGLFYSSPPLQRTELTEDRSYLGPSCSPAGQGQKMLRMRMRKPGLCHFQPLWPFGPLFPIHKQGCAICNSVPLAFGGQDIPGR